MHICPRPHNQLSNYRPISNLAVISKITERVVKSRLTDHRTSNKLLNPHQSAYCKHYSTETVLLYILDHLINAIGSSCLCLLDLSAGFNTKNHGSSHSPASHLGLASMALSLTVFCHLAPSVSDVITLSRPCIPPPAVFPKAPFSVICFSSCTPPPQYSHLLPFPEPPP